MAAHNEERVIEQKLLDRLALQLPSEQLKIVIASDGSTDADGRNRRSLSRSRGAALALPPAARQVRLLNAAIAQTGGEILVLSDANTEYHGPLPF